MSARRNLADYYPRREVREATRRLARDPRVRRHMAAHGQRRVEELFWTERPLKYLGIELGTDEPPRFSLDEAVGLLLAPRSADGASRGLRRSRHREAFREAFRRVDEALSREGLKALGAAADVVAEAWPRSRYVAAVRPALRRLQGAIGLPWRIAAEVLRKGLAAYRRSHRPGMSAHGWAVARLTSFVMKGCTHYFPDHRLVEAALEAAPPKLAKFWAARRCLCPKQGQCRRPGRATRANAIAEKRTPAKG